MKINIIASDDKTQILENNLQASGYDFNIQSDPALALKSAGERNAQVFFVDAACVGDIKDFNIKLRRNALHYITIIIIDSGLQDDEIITFNANAAISPEADLTDFNKVIADAKRLNGYIKRFGDASVDFPNAGGVIAKSAFNQLYLSSLERAERYAERSFLLFISIANYDDIMVMDGHYPADFSVAELSQELVRLRRQSDIIGQVDKSEFCLLLGRPENPNEPQQAATRFRDSLMNDSKVKSTGLTDIKLRVLLVECPSGAVKFDDSFNVTTNDNDTV